MAPVREDNALGLHDISRIFGGRIFGRNSSSADPASDNAGWNANNGGVHDTIFNTMQTRRGGEMTMAWSCITMVRFLKGLFDVIDDTKFRRPLFRRDRFAEDLLSSNLPPTPSSVKNLEFCVRDESQDEGDDLFGEGVANSFGDQMALPCGDADGYDSETPVLRIPINGGPPIHPTQKSSPANVPMLLN